MKKKKILLGFTDETFEKSIKELLRSTGYEAEILARVTKESVKEAVNRTEDLDCVVVMESFPKLSRTQKVQKYTAEELAALTDDSSVNVIAVLSENHKGTDYARILFSAGITCAIFTKAGKGVTSKEVATLILRKRTRKAAREYYGIGQGNIDLGFLETDDFNELYERYSNRGGTPIENFVYLCMKLTEKQVADFIKRLPKEDREYLANFEEFHQITDALKKLGYDLNVKRPEKVQIGLSGKAAMISVKNGAMVMDVDEGDRGAAPDKKTFSLFGKKKEKTDEENSQEQFSRKRSAIETEMESMAEETKEEVFPVGESAETGELSGAGSVPGQKDPGQEVAPASEEGSVTVGDGFDEMSMEDMLAMLSGGSDTGCSEANKPFSWSESVSQKRKERVEPRELPGVSSEESVGTHREVAGMGVAPALRKKDKKEDMREKIHARGLASGEEAVRHASDRTGNTKSPREPTWEEEEQEGDEPTLFEEYEDVELRDLYSGKSGVYLLALFLFVILLAGLGYFGGGSFELGF